MALFNGFMQFKEEQEWPPKTELRTDLIASGSEPVTVHRERCYLPYLNPDWISGTHFVQSLGGGRVLIVGAS